MESASREGAVNKMSKKVRSNSLENVRRDGVKGAGGRAGGGNQGKNLIRRQGGERGKRGE